MTAISSKSNLRPLPPTSASVDTTAGGVVVVAANPDRAGLVIINTSDVNVSLALDGQNAVSGAGIVIFANGGTYNMDEYSFTVGIIKAIAASGSSKTLAIQEWSQS